MLLLLSVFPPPVVPGVVAASRTSNARIALRFISAHSKNLHSKKKQNIKMPPPTIPIQVKARRYLQC